MLFLTLPSRMTLSEPRNRETSGANRERETPLHGQALILPATRLRFDSQDVRLSRHPWKQDARVWSSVLFERDLRIRSSRGIINSSIKCRENISQTKRPRQADAHRGLCQVPRPYMLLFQPTRPLDATLQYRPRREVSKRKRPGGLPHLAFGFDGARYQTRTDDPRFTRAVLYQLS